VLQVVKGKYYAENCREPADSLLPIPAPRGVIFDRDGHMLVDSRPIYEVILLTPGSQRKKTRDLPSLVQPLAEGLGVDADILRDRFEQVKIIGRPLNRFPSNRRRRPATLPGSRRTSSSFPRCASSSSRSAAIRRTGCWRTCWAMSGNKSGTTGTANLVKIKVSSRRYLGQEGIEKVYARTICAARMAISQTSL